MRCTLTNETGTHESIVILMVLALHLHLGDEELLMVEVVGGGRREAQTKGNRSDGATSERVCSEHNTMAIKFEHCL